MNKTLKIAASLGFVSLAVFAYFFIAKSELKKQLDLELKTISEEGRIQPGTEVRVFKGEELIYSDFTNSYGICKIPLFFFYSEINVFRIELSDFYQGGSKLKNIELKMLVPEDLWKKTSKSLNLTRSVKF